MHILITTFTQLYQNHVSVFLSSPGNCCFLDGLYLILLCLSQLLAQVLGSYYTLMNVMDWKSASMFCILETNVSDWVEGARVKIFLSFWRPGYSLEYPEASWHVRWFAISFLWPFPKWDYLLTVLISLYGSLPQTPTTMDIQMWKSK